ncbi:probable NAD(P)H dehydrogenase (quinone) FQR1-like 2 [Raphanus sativus]|uniref:Probable NAD(P)H dehydrogenase (Quinone) FQR1-like 2 n=2 Tax=Raphanus sativus TaxID=3726 RepID=A0A6J0NZ49_RAPSA|nr:probable NAD(P)H dehydrogenase (quinone) FQR1-like 2 [Raphanus sativus]
MRKGGVCVPSKKKKPSSLATTTADGPGTDDATIPIEDDRTTTGTTTPVITARTISPPLKIFVVFYSMYGHVESLAKRMKKGAEGVEGVEAKLYRVPETLSQEVVEQMKAPVAELAEADGFLAGVLRCWLVCQAKTMPSRLIQ